MRLILSSSKTDTNNMYSTPITRNPDSQVRFSNIRDIQGRIKQHKLSSLAKAKALRRPLRMRRTTFVQSFYKSCMLRSHKSNIGHASRERKRHPRKDKSSIRSQAWRRRKHLGGHCECFEKQAFEFIIIDLQKL
ncbi:hypothetical protein NC652_017400 [Populus alba x Populus x berolinensis]|nr:hypothetical protein NC652_017400 [Populus alba x Populus x berolinensis]